MSPPTVASGPLLSLLAPFAVAFTAPTFEHVLVLVSGTILASGRRTVVAALRAAGLGEERRFTTYHRVLNRGVWSALVLSRLLLDLLVRTFLAPEAPLELVVDGTLERRRGRKLAWKGRFHDAARSQSGHVVTSDGIHWVCDAARPRPLEPAPLGPAVPDDPDLHPGNERQTGETPPDRAGADRGADPPDPPLAAPPNHRGGRGQ